MQCALETFIREKTGAFPGSPGQREPAGGSAAVKVNSTRQHCTVLCVHHVEGAEKYKVCSLHSEHLVCCWGDKKHGLLEARE